jgi:hypothetical protein
MAIFQLLNFNNFSIYLKLIYYFDSGARLCRFMNLGAPTERSPKNWFQWTQKPSGVRIVKREPKRSYRPVRSNLLAADGTRMAIRLPNQPAIKRAIDS